MSKKPIDTSTVELLDASLLTQINEKNIYNIDSLLSSQKKNETSKPTTTKEDETSKPTTKKDVTRESTTTKAQKKEDEEPKGSREFDAIVPSPTKKSSLIKKKNVPPAPQSNTKPPLPPKLNKSVNDCNDEFEAVDKNKKLSNRQKARRAMNIVTKDSRCGEDDTRYDEFYNKFIDAAEKDEIDPNFGNKGPPKHEVLPVSIVVKEPIDVEKLKQDHEQKIKELEEKHKQEIQNIGTRDKEALNKAKKDHEEVLNKLTIEQNNKINNLQNTAKTKQTQLKNQLNQIKKQKKRLQQQLTNVKGTIQDQEYTKMQIKRLEKVEKSSKESIEKHNNVIEQLKKEKAELEATRSETQKAFIKLMKKEEEEKRKRMEKFLENTGGELEKAIGDLKKGNFMSEIKIEALEDEKYDVLRKKIINFLVFKEDELIKAHHAKFYSDNIKRNNNKLVETLTLFPGEPFLGIELVAAFGNTPEKKEEVKKEKPEEEEINLKEIKEKVRKFIIGRAKFIFNYKEHEQLSVKEYLKNL